MTEELKELLGEDGSRVYKEVEKALQGGNARVKSAASVGAALLAAHAATWAERVSRATGKPFTAQDYMKSVMIEADGTVREGALNALRSGVDLDERVKVVDISHAIPKKGMSNREIKDFLSELTRKQLLSVTEDNLAAIRVLAKDIRHLTYSSKKGIDRKSRRIRNSALLSLEELTQNAILIESIPNRKKGRKPNVRAYHRLYVPVRIGTELKTIRIVAEEQEGVITLMPTDVNVYDVLLEDVHTNKGGSAATSTGISPAGRPDNASSDTISIREMLAGVKDADGKTYYQQAWHGAAKKFDAFSLDYVGTGDGGSAHAHGLYFAKERSFAESYRGEDGALLEVEIPDDEYLLKENAYFKEQSPSVQQALREIAEGWGEVERGEKSVDEALAGKSGRDLYFKVMEEVGEFARKEKCMRDDGTFFYICSDPLEGTEARVSEHFSKHGVKGVSFTDYGDPGFVIFDPQDAEIIARYQKSLGRIQGQFSVLQEGSRLVSLFEAADESTFLHETAHIFYDDLARLAPFDEETAEDLAEVDAWASWYEGAAKEYEEAAMAR